MIQHVHQPIVLATAATFLSLFMHSPGSAARLTSGLPLLGGCDGGRCLCLKIVFAQHLVVLHDISG